MARDRRGNGAGHAGKGEQRDAVLRQMEGAGEQQRHRGPEQAERAEQECVIQRAALQDRRVPGEPDHRRQQRAVAQARRRLAARQRDPQHDGQARHHHRRNDEHGVPRQRLGDEARDRPGEHDPQHQPAHDVADNAAPDGLGRKVGGVGHENLHRHRAEPDQQGSAQEGRRVRRQGGADKGQQANAEGGEDKAAVLEQVAERHDEQQPGAVADLRHGDDQAGGLRRQAERGADRADEGLGVVDVGDDEAASRRKQQRQPSRDAGRLPRRGGRRKGRAQEALLMKSAAANDAPASGRNAWSASIAPGMQPSD